MTTKSAKSNALIEDLEPRRMMSVTSVTVDNGTLTVIGSESPDHVNVTPNTVYTNYRGIPGFYPVLDVNDFSTSTTKTTRFFAMGINKIVMRGLGAEDHLSCHDVNVPCDLYGGEGWDELGGGSKDDLIVPGAGSDSCYGQGGNDVFIDEDGTRDVLNGGEGHDVVISTLPTWTERYINVIQEVEQYEEF